MRPQPFACLSVSGTCLQEWALEPSTTAWLATYNQMLGLAADWALVGRLADAFPERVLLFAAMVLAAINSAVESSHRRFPLYALLHLPLGAVSKSVSRTCLSSVFSKSVPRDSAGLAFSILDLFSSATSIIAPLYGGFLFGRLGVAAQPALAAANYCVLAAASWLLLAGPRHADSVAVVQAHAKRD